MLRLNRINDSIETTFTDVSVMYVKKGLQYELQNESKIHADTRIEIHANESLTDSRN